MIPDGNGEFTHGIDMLVQKNNLGFGMRSWRYAAIINDNHIEKMLSEPGKEDNVEDDPYNISSPENVMKYLKGEEYVETKMEK
jgi:peroxiredoxin